MKQLGDLKQLRDRWTTSDGRATRARLLAILAQDNAVLNASFGGFGTIEGRLDLRGIDLEGEPIVTRGPRFPFAHHHWLDIDLSGASFGDWPLSLENSVLRNVRFGFSEGSLGLELQQCQLEDVVFCHIDFAMTDAHNRFDRVRWIDCNCRDAAIGVAPSEFNQCRFQRVRFYDCSFHYPQFDGCIFEYCRLKEVDFHLSAFSRCKFVGPVTRVIFRGLRASRDTWLANGRFYWRWVKRIQPPKPNQMNEVDFSEAELSEVSFFNRCDLSSVILPADPLVERIDDWQKLRWELLKAPGRQFSAEEWRYIELRMEDGIYRPYNKQFHVIVNFGDWSLRGLQQDFSTRAHDHVVQLARRLGVLGNARRGARSEPGRDQ